MLIAREVAMACRIGVEVMISSQLFVCIFVVFCISDQRKPAYSCAIPQVAIVVGGRNFFCGDTWVTSTGLDRSTAYQIG